MKKVLILCVALALYATSAFAVGADLTATACPGNAGSASEVGTFDCSVGDVLQFFCNFQPNEAIPDLVGIDCVCDLAVQGDLATTASFWDFGTGNPAALGLSHTRPAAGCTGYLSTWSPVGSGEAVAYAPRSPSITRMGIVAFRPTILAVTANQKLFGWALTVDTGTSAEFNGGVGPAGCSTVPATMVLQQLSPGSSTGAATSLLVAGSLASNCNLIGANGTAGSPNCLAVPVQRHTWGRLKSLYR
jgi:hypothetical protein